MSISRGFWTKHRIRDQDLKKRILKDLAKLHEEAESTISREWNPSHEQKHIQLCVCYKVRNDKCYLKILIEGGWNYCVLSYDVHKHVLKLISRPEPLDIKSSNIPEFSYLYDKVKSFNERDPPTLYQQICTVTKLPPSIVNLILSFSGDLPKNINHDTDE